MSTSTSILRLAAVLAAWFLVTAPLGAKVFLTLDEALELAFPGCEVERQTVFLTAEQAENVAERAGTELPSRVAHPYRATCPEAEQGGVAYFDAHRVRTLEETLMVVVDPSGEVRRIEILSFREPEEYIPRDAWYAQFTGRGLGEGLEVDREIRPATGATLTVVATTAAVRRVLALHQVLAAEAGT